MRRMWLGLLPTTALAVPMTLEHQGRLLDDLGQPVSGPILLDVALYALPEGGEPLFSQRFSGLPVTDGYYSVTLTGLEDDDLDGATRYLGLAVDEGDELRPRTRLSSVAYAIRSEQADRVVSFGTSDCDAGRTGALEYRASDETLYLCNGEEWFAIGTGAPDTGPPYAYERTLTLSGSAGAGPGYAVRLTVGQDATATSDVHLAGHALSFPAGEADCGDLGFFAGGAPLPFWVEEVTGGVATVWVRVAADLGSDQDIVLRYGLADAENLCDGAGTFLLFDDFEDGVVDTTMWSPQGAFSESGGSGFVGDNANSQAYLLSLAEFDVGTQMVWDGRINDERYTYALDGYRGAGLGFGTFWEPARSDIHTYAPEGVQATAFPKGGSHHFAVQRGPDGTVRHRLNGVLQPTAGGVDDAGLSIIGWQAGNTNGLPDQIDYVFVTPYVSPEPAVSAVGTETVR